jgi:hypothetical protein
LFVCQSRKSAAARATDAEGAQWWNSGHAPS